MQKLKMQTVTTVFTVMVCHQARVNLVGMPTAWKQVPGFLTDMCMP